MPPPITLFMTTIASQPALRQRQEYILRILQVKKIPFTTYDLASDEDAKRLWRRKAPADKQQLPGILVGGKLPGTFAEFEDAVEHDELDIFLRLKDEWDPKIDEERPAPEAKPVGIPGAMTPLQMTPDRLKKTILAGTPSPSPLKGNIIPANKRTGEFDLGDKLSGYGLQGVKVTEDDLRALVEELGLGGDDAGDLVKGLSDITAASAAEERKSAVEEEAEGKTEKIVKKEDIETGKITKKEKPKEVGKENEAEKEKEVEKGEDLEEVSNVEKVREGEREKITEAAATKKDGQVNNEEINLVAEA